MESAKRNDPKEITQEPSCFELGYPELLRKAEVKAVTDRRTQHDVRDGEKQKSDDQLPDDTVGIALGGGGIRSATFSLGVFQALAKADMLRRVDFLSTVSGGGYFGACLGRLFLKHGHKLDGRGKPDDITNRVQDDLTDPESDVLRWLRDNGRYLSPNGSRDKGLALVSILRNLVFIHFVYGLFLVSILFAADLISRGVMQFMSFILRGFDGWFHGLIRLPEGFCPLENRRAWDEIEGSYVFGTTHAMWPIAAFVLWVLPAAWAYWLTPRANRRHPTPLLASFVIISSAVHVAWNVHTKDHYLLQFLSSLTAISGAMTLVLWWSSGKVVERMLATYKVTSPAEDRAIYVNKGRLQQTRLTSWLTAGALVAFLLELFSLLDSFGEFLYGMWIGWWTDFRAARMIQISAGVVIIFTLCVGGIHHLASIHRRRIREVGESAAVQPTKRFTAFALVATCVVLLVWAMFEHWLFWAGKRPGAVREFPDNSWLWIIAAILVVLCLAVSRVWGFLNLSSHQRAYADRLSRAFLGAANEERTGDRSTKTSDVLPGDDLLFSNYNPHVYGGPLHLINVTLNQTVGGETNREQRDRKGMPMAIGPEGVSIGLRHHAVWCKDTPAKSGDRYLRYKAVRHGSKPCLFDDVKDDDSESDVVALSSWIAVSGAAFGTGIGSYTRWDTSALFALFNLRLGYWWDSGKTRCAGATVGIWSKAKQWFIHSFPVPVCLFEEWMALFYNPAYRRYWHLSDGGHYENTGCYELIRRRVPVMMVCDTGRDPHYTFSDMSALVRMARIDFHVRIQFLKRDEIDLYVDPLLHDVVGTEEELRAAASDKNQNPESSETCSYRPRHAALAWVYYQDDREAPGSILLWIKPGLTGDEPLDLWQYSTQNSNFPQDSTAQQFFTETQWESYRALGEHIGEKLFGESNKGWDTLLNMLEKKRDDVCAGRSEKQRPGQEDEGIWGRDGETVYEENTVRVSDNRVKATRLRITLKGVSTHNGGENASVEY